MRILHQEATNIVNEMFRNENRRYNFVTKRSTPPTETQNQSQPISDNLQQPAIATDSPAAEGESRSSVLESRTEEPAPAEPKMNTKPLKQTELPKTKPKTIPNTEEENKTLSQIFKTPQSVKPRKPEGSSKHSGQFRRDRSAERRYSLDSDPPLSPVSPRDLQSSQQERAKQLKRPNESPPSQSRSQSSKLPRNNQSHEHKKTSPIPVIDGSHQTPKHKSYTNS